MAQGLERIVQHRQFQALPYEQQVALMSNVLQRVQPELAEDANGLTAASEKMISRYRPRTQFEQIGSFVSGFIPVAGPLIQQYAFGAEVPPPGLLTSLGVVEEDNPYGALIRSGLDIPLMIGGGLVGGLAVRTLGARFLPSLLNQSIPALISRELIAGTASGTGELVLDPPQSVAEAGARLGLSAVAQATVTTAGRMLFGAEARTRRGLVNELGEDGLSNFKVKVNLQQFNAITDDEISAVERAIGRRTDNTAVTIRQELLDIKSRRDAMLTELETDVAQRNRLLREEFTENSQRQTAAEQDVAYQETLARQTQAETWQVATQRQTLQEMIDIESVSSAKYVAEQAREKEVNTLLAQIERAPAERGSTQFLASEKQLVDLLEDYRVHGTDTDAFPFVSGQPTTLPLGMVQDYGPNVSRAVVVDRFEGGRATLRYLGNVDAATVRLPKTLDEQLAVQRLAAEQGISPYPTYGRAKEILEARVAAERNTRLAMIESQRFNAREASVQREIFRLRKAATLDYLKAHNRTFSEDLNAQITKIRALDDRRTIGSLEGLSTADLEAASKALRAAGFEQVRTSLNPDGTFNVTYSNYTAPETARAAGLYGRYSTYKGTFDPTSAGTYGGLTPAEHELVGKAFGIDAKDRAHFNVFVDSYIKELRDRGLRFPLTTEAMGVDLVENQVQRGLKHPERMRSDVIARSSEDVRRIEPGDVIEYRGQKSIGQLYVAEKDVTPDPSGSGAGTFTYRTLPVEQVAEFLSGNPNIVQIPLTEHQLRNIGAKRSVEYPIAAEQQPKFSMESPSRNIGDLFGIDRGQMPPLVVEGNDKAMREAAKDLGVGYSASKQGMVTLQVQKLTLPELTAEDAALVLTRLKQINQERATLSNFFRGCV